MGTPLTKTIPQNTSYIQNGIRVDTNEVSNNLGFGVQQPTLCLYNLVPLIASAALICPSNTVPASGALTLRANASTNGLGGLGVTLDCNRAVSVYLTWVNGGSAATTFTSAATVTCNGYDDRGVPLSSVINFTTGQALGTGTLFVATFPKMYSRVTSVTWNGGTTVTISAAPVTMNASVGTGSSASSIKNIVGTALGITTPQTNAPGGIDAFGLPYFCPYRQYVLSATWGNANTVSVSGSPQATMPNLYSIPIITFGSGASTTGGFVPGYQFNPLGATGAPALPSTTSTDARGYVFTPTSSNGPMNTSPTGTQLYGQPAFNTSDGIYNGAGYNMLSVLFYAYGADSYVQSQLTNGVASAQMQTLIFGPTNPYIGYGSTTPSAQPSQLYDRDEVGLQNSTPGV